MNNLQMLHLEEVKVDLRESKQVRYDANVEDFTAEADEEEDMMDENYFSEEHYNMY